MRVAADDTWGDVFSRVLVGTRKGAFILTSDGKRERWDVDGPHFGGWEIYHLKGSPADPNRLYASQSSGWFGQLIQRSNDGGKTWERVLFVNDSTGASDLVMDPNNPRILFAGFWQVEVHTWGRSSGGASPRPARGGSSRRSRRRA